MHFLADVYVTCEVCQGKRYNEATLRVQWKGKSIADVLESQRRRRRSSCSPTTGSLRDILETLDDVGLGYIALGQSATTLSGGEAQRVKLSRELAKRDTGRTLYLLDEPTTGLHFEDVRRLLAVLGTPGRRRQHRARHRAQPRRHQDRRLGHRPRPRGRRRAARSSPTGTPEQVAAVPGSYTGQFLGKLLRRRSEPPAGIGKKAPHRRGRPCP